MLKYIKQGWNAAVQQPFVVVTLFLYRFAWGFLLYEIVKSVVIPLQYRYPGEAAPERVKLFLAEAQFQLFKTDLVHPYLWLLLGLLLVKMLLTPLFNSAVCYSLEHTRLNYGYRFFKGMKELAKPFYLIYLVQLIAVLTPLYWLLPAIARSVEQAQSYQELLLHGLPWVAGWIMYSSLIKILLLYIQLAFTCSIPWTRALTCLLRSFLLAVGTALSLWGIGLLVGAAVLTTVFLWAGFWALVIYQLFRFVESFLSVWRITAQHQLLTDRAA
ncbi:hypothetical protein [Paenibacillus senegalensis]|uniref:hypothetical protein n=1 Tax=Paenibacillus senegalensis TaxID=1465766 RepID=UPI0002882C7E|nr:hypothetical protein [Paenibacillus senegalensis]